MYRSRCRERRRIIVYSPDELPEYLEPCTLYDFGDIVFEPVERLRGAEVWSIVQGLREMLKEACRGV